MPFIDGLITGAILAFIILMFWAKMEKKEIMDLLKDLKELLVDTQEEEYEYYE